jgi:hypothetical protein
MRTNGNDVIYATGRLPGRLYKKTNFLVGHFSSPDYH